MQRLKDIITIISLLVIPFNYAHGQLSPGPLAEVHSHLEGLSNCTKCHTLGDKVTNEKCLACHTELKERISLGKGYHSSLIVKGKQCAGCHNDHHGKQFQIIRFDIAKFDHKLAGYELKGAHKALECKECHKKEFISNKKIREKKMTYLGLGTNCLDCHPDYHQKTLSAKCSDCHNNEKFKPATLFNHQKTDFPLAGKHQDVGCKECHPITTRTGKPFQQFSDISHSNCSSCHTDAHNNKFGQNCKQCHTEQSFHVIKGMSNFDHSKTRFALLGRHQGVDCKSCHKEKYTGPIAFTHCSDCHKDYHEKQFMKENRITDCSECHNVSGFSGTSFTIERHNESPFPLEGAHLATPCFSCHKKTEKWKFRNIGKVCVDCHNDIHYPNIDTVYYPGSDCRACHSQNRWTDISFDHSRTGFSLSGAHLNQSCRQCHFSQRTDGANVQRFKGLSAACASCHKDVHFNQFEKEGLTNCDDCHEPITWAASRFNHNKTRFPLDGKHKELACLKCHKRVEEEGKSFVKYKYNGEIKCETCH